MVGIDKLTPPSTHRGRARTRSSKCIAKRTSALHNSTFQYNQNNCQQAYQSVENVEMHSSSDSLLSGGTDEISAEEVQNVNECCNNTNKNNTGSKVLSYERELMRAWLENKVNNGSYPGLRWYNAEHTRVQIPWVHGSRHCWNPDQHSELFRGWAEHTGRYNSDNPDAKRWKANFRSALNSLPDVREVKELRKKGQNAYKVYELDEKPVRKETITTRGRPRTKTEVRTGPTLRTMKRKRKPQTPVTRTKLAIRQRLHSHQASAPKPANTHAHNDLPRMPRHTFPAVHEQYGHTNNHTAIIQSESHSVPPLLNSSTITENKAIPTTVEQIANDNLQTETPSKNVPQYYGYLNMTTVDQPEEDTCSSPVNMISVVKPCLPTSCEAMAVTYDTPCTANTLAGLENSYTTSELEQAILNQIFQQSTGNTAVQFENILLDDAMDAELEDAVSVINSDANSSGYLSDTSTGSDHSNQGNVWATLQTVPMTHNTTEHPQVHHGAPLYHCNAF